MKSADPVKTLRSFRSRSTSRTGRSRCLEWPPEPVVRPTTLLIHHVNFPIDALRKIYSITSSAAPIADMEPKTLQLATVSRQRCVEQFREWRRDTVPLPSRRKRESPDSRARTARLLAKV